MTDNSEDETLDNPINPKSENLSEEIISTDTTDSIITKQKTENMETHAHHIHKAPGKGLMHYFYEFLMLFLAVFCGFLAENFRENRVENEREKQYMESMVVDLKMDTTNLADVIASFNKKAKQFDTLYMYFDKLSKKYNDTLFRNLIAINGFADFIYTDRTMQQLKNSGNMRLIKNKSVADAIVDYDSRVRDLNEIDIPDLTLVYRLSKDIQYISIDNQALIADKKIKTASEMEKGDKNYLLQNDKITLGKLYNNIVDYEAACALAKEKEITLKERATILIALIKKEFQLE